MRNIIDSVGVGETLQDQEPFHLRVIATDNDVAAYIKYVDQLPELFSQLPFAVEEKLTPYNLLHNFGSRYVLAIGARDLLGAAMLSIVHTYSCIYGEVGDVIVKPHHRHRGIGRSLMMEACRLAWLQDCTEVRLEVHPDLVAANQFYPSIGFKLTGISTGLCGRNSYKCFPS